MNFKNITKFLIIPVLLMGCDGDKTYLDPRCNGLKKVVTDHNTGQIEHLSVIRELLQILVMQLHETNKILEELHR